MFIENHPLPLEIIPSFLLWVNVLSNEHIPGVPSASMTHLYSHNAIMPYVRMSGVHMGVSNDGVPVRPSARRPPCLSILSLSHGVDDERGECLRCRKIPYDPRGIVRLTTEVPFCID